MMKSYEKIQGTWICQGTDDSKVRPGCSSVDELSFFLSHKS